MTLMEFAGCALTAYGPALSLFILTIMDDPIRIIILVVSAFHWLLALLFSSLFWNLVVKDVLLLCIFISVILQEFCRFLVYILLKEAEYGLKKIRVPNTNMDVLSNKQIIPYVSGLGYGVMSGGFSLGNILAELSGPGTVGLKGAQPYFCLITSIFTMMFIFLHTFWSIIFFSSFDTKNKRQFFWVVCSHIFVSCITLVNEKGLYYVSLPTTTIVLIISGYLAFSICKQSRSQQNNSTVVQNR